MKMIPVNDSATKKEFLEFPVRLYSKDINYIRPLNKDIEEVFDPERNKFFRHGICMRWLCVDDNNNTIGKVAAFVNKRYKQDQPTGGIGFFDCIQNKEVAFFIFDHCKSWLQEQGMEAMDGPINFGERDKWWGLVVEGFIPPIYCMNYNPAYYQQFFEEYGFQAYFHQLCYGRDALAPIAEKIVNAHQRLKQKDELRLELITKDKMDKYAIDFMTVYNKAWASHGEGKQLEARQAKKLFKSMKPIFDKDISFIVYHSDQPVAAWINLPDLNQWFKYLKGKFSVIHKIKFMLVKLFKKNRKFVGIVFGVIPEWQKKGVDSFMIVEGAQHYRTHTSYTDFEMQWIGDFNPKMIKVAESLDTYLTRKLTTYRYLFDRDKAFSPLKKIY